MSHFRRCVKCIWIGFNGAKRNSFIFHDDVWLYTSVVPRPWCCFLPLVFYWNLICLGLQHLLLIHNPQSSIIIVEFTQSNCDKCLNNSKSYHPLCSSSIHLSHKYQNSSVYIELCACFNGFSEVVFQVFQE